MNIGRSLVNHYRDGIEPLNLSRDSTSVVTEEGKLMSVLPRVLVTISPYDYYTVPGSWDQYKDQIIENRTVLFIANRSETIREETPALQMKEAFSLAMALKLRSERGGLIHSIHSESSDYLFGMDVALTEFFRLFTEREAHDCWTDLDSDFVQSFVERVRRSYPMELNGRESLPEYIQGLEDICYLYIRSYDYWMFGGEK